MIEHIELSDLDLRYESYRLRSQKEEQHLINSVLNHGIRDPLQGVATEVTVQRDFDKPLKKS